MASSTRRKRPRPLSSLPAWLITVLLLIQLAEAFVSQIIWRKELSSSPLSRPPHSSGSSSRSTTSIYSYNNLVEDLAYEMYDRSRPSPLIITIGPQCCGKSTILRRINETRPREAPPLLDVAIDNDREVYRRVLMQALLDEDSDGNIGGDDMSVLGRSIGNRCSDPAPLECRAVLRYFTGLSTLTEAESILADLPSTAEIHQDLINAMERSVDIGKGNIRARWFRLFIPEAIPRAVRRSNKLLIDAVNRYSGPVAWGNTNAKPSDFKGALKAAASAGRRVILLRWGQEFEQVSLHELLLRNILRAARIGRYVPALSIKRALERTDRLISSSAEGDFGQLISMAGYTVDAEGRPRATIPPIDETSPIIRPFITASEEGKAAAAAAEVDQRMLSFPRREERAVRATAAAEKEGEEEDDQRMLPLETASWGRSPSQYRYSTGRSVALTMGDSSGRRWKEALLRDARRLAEALKWLRQPSQTLLGIPTFLMGKEWSKWKSWSRNAYRLEYEWKIEYQKARNQTLKEEEDDMKSRNGTSRDRGTDFDWDRFVIMRSIMGWRK